MNLTFAYLSILSASMKDRFLGIVAIMACDTPASCVGTMLGNEEEQPLDLCVCAS